MAVASVNPGGYDTAITNMANKAKGSTYRQFLQSIVNGAPNSTQGKEAAAILAVTGDDGVVNPAFVSDPYKYTNSESGQVVGGYGPQGVQRINSIYLNAYNAANPGGGGGGTVDVAAQRRAAEAGRLRGDIRGRGSELNAIYDSLFGDLDTLLRTRADEVEKNYGEQLTKATDQYATALPTIQNSYAAIGAADSTDTADAKDKAKFGFDETTSTIGKNKGKDLAAIGQYGNEQRAKFTSDKQALERNLGRVDETDDVDALRGVRSDIETNLGAAQVTKQTLGTEGKAAKDLSALTQDAGRFEAASTALDNILKSSMSGAVKEAAVKAVVDNAGLSDEEKKKVQLQFGNVYQEQNAA